MGKLRPGGNPEPSPALSHPSTSRLGLDWPPPAGFSSSRHLAGRRSSIWWGRCGGSGCGGFGLAPASRLGRWCLLLLGHTAGLLVVLFLKRIFILFYFIYKEYVHVYYLVIKTIYLSIYLAIKNIYCLLNNTTYLFTYLYVYLSIRNICLFISMLFISKDYLFIYLFIKNIDLSTCLSKILVCFFTTTIYLSIYLFHENIYLFIYLCTTY